MQIGWRKTSFAPQRARKLNTTRCEGNFAGIQALSLAKGKPRREARTVADTGDELTFLSLVQASPNQNDIFHEAL